MPAYELAVDEGGGAGKDSACAAGALACVEVALGVGVLNLESAVVAGGAYLIYIVGIVGGEGVVIACGGGAASAEGGGVDGGIVAKGLPVSLVVADEEVVAIGEWAHLGGLGVGVLQLLAQGGFLLIGEGGAGALPGGGNDLAQCLDIVGIVEAGLLLGGQGGGEGLILGADGHQAGIGLVEFLHHLGANGLDVPYVDAKLGGLGV